MLTEASSAHKLAIYTNLWNRKGSTDFHTAQQGCQNKSHYPNPIQIDDKTKRDHFQMFKISC